MSGIFSNVYKCINGTNEKRKLMLVEFENKVDVKEKIISDQKKKLLDITVMNSVKILEQCKLDSLPTINNEQEVEVNDKNLIKIMDPVKLLEQYKLGLMPNINCNNKIEFEEVFTQLQNIYYSVNTRYNDIIFIKQYISKLINILLDIYNSKF
jgi:hypothetical protein